MCLKIRSIQKLCTMYMFTFFSFFFCKPFPPRLIDYGNCIALISWYLTLKVRKLMYIKNILYTSHNFLYSTPECKEKKKLLFCQSLFILFYLSFFSFFYLNILFWTVRSTPSRKKILFEEICEKCYCLIYRDSPTIKVSWDDTTRQVGLRVWWTVSQSEPLVNQF